MLIEVTYHNIHNVIEVNLKQTKRFHRRFDIIDLSTHLGTFKVNVPIAWNLIVIVNLR